MSQVQTQTLLHAGSAGQQATSTTTPHPSMYSKVDDDTNEEGDDDDDLEALTAQGQNRAGDKTTTDGANPGSKAASKSVRLAADDDGERSGR